MIIDILEKEGGDRSSTCTIETSGTDHCEATHKFSTETSDTLCHPATEGMSDGVDLVPVDTVIIGYLFEYGIDENHVFFFSP
jgi:hypothetical protein